MNLDQALRCAVSDNKVEAALKLHFRNHGPKLLETLREMLTNLCDADRDGDAETIDELDRVLQAAEEMDLI